MKLTEAIQIPLHESFKDLGNVIDSKIEGTFDYEISNDELQEMADIGIQVPRTSIQNTRDLVVVIKWAIQHPSFTGDRVSFVGDQGDVSTWMRMVKNGRFFTHSSIDSHLAFNVLRPLMKKLESQQNTKEYDSYNRGNYIISILDTYEKARSYCNKNGLNWCIGANRDLHREYSENNQRETYAIEFPDRSHIAIHSGPTSFLITTGDNSGELSSDGRGRNPDAVIDQIYGSGMGASNVMNMVKDTIHPLQQRKAMMELV